MAAFCCTAVAFLLTWWLLHFCFHSHGQPYSPACVGMCHSFFLMHYLVLFFFFHPVNFLQDLAVAVELEFLCGSSSLFPPFCLLPCITSGSPSSAEAWQSWGSGPAERMSAAVCRVLLQGELLCSERL